MISQKRGWLWILAAWVAILLCRIPKSVFIRLTDQIAFPWFLLRSFLNKTFLSTSLPSIQQRDWAAPPLQLKVQLLSPAAKSQVRGREHECSCATPLLPRLEHTGCLHISSKVGITENYSSIPPLRLPLGRSDILQSMSGTFMQLLIIQGCPGQCSCHSRLGLQLLLSQQELSRGSLQLPLSLSCFAIISFAVIQDIPTQITLATGPGKRLLLSAKWDFTYFSTDFLEWNLEGVPAGGSHIL